jgi:hypothetical protein
MALVQVAQTHYIHKELKAKRPVQVWFPAHAISFARKVIEAHVLPRRAALDPAISLNPTPAERFAAVEPMT